jgi:hypothetical protein
MHSADVVDTDVFVGYIDAITYSIGPEDPDPDPVLYDCDGCTFFSFIFRE